MRLYTSILVLLVGCAVVQVHSNQPEIRKITIGDLVKENPELLHVLRSVKPKSSSIASPPAQAPTTTPASTTTTTVPTQSTTKESTRTGGPPGGRRRKVQRGRPQGNRRNRQRENQKQEAPPTATQNARRFPTPS